MRKRKKTRASRSRKLGAESTPSAQSDLRRDSVKRRASPRRIGLFSAIVVFAAAAGWIWSNRDSNRETRYRPAESGTLTFNKDIAPIVFSRCSSCHRPGQAAPFALLNYGDIKKHTRQIQRITADRIMPPWLPEPGHGEFDGVRRLTDQELGMLQQWLSEGAMEGDAADPPDLPEWPGGWTFGRPDLVSEMPEAFELHADGADVYRNFVVPIRLEEPRFVKAVEFNPGNRRAVHHAFVKFDSTQKSRQADAGDSELGFPGMAESAVMPDGHFLSWQPGSIPIPGDPDLAWRLERKTDMVVQMHLRPTGKPESVRASVAFYFSNRPPKHKTFKIALMSLATDIPAGAGAYSIGDDYVLPIDVMLTAVLPHAHYLGKQVTGWATTPSGEEIPLIQIKRWDFSWQGHYRYKQPIELPKGTTLSMEWIYDNSTNNVSNPFHPPRRVVYGPESTDEMTELWFQLLPKNEGDLALLEADYQLKNHRLFIEGAKHKLSVNPRDAYAHHQFAFGLFAQGKAAEAYEHWQKAVELDPLFDEPHYYLGILYRTRQQLNKARGEFQTAVRLNDQNGKAHGNLGIIEAQLGNTAEAIAHFRRALEINPSDTIAKESLKELQRVVNQKPGIEK